MRGAPAFMSTARLEAFSDGVFAIAVTLLILEIKVPPAQDRETAAALWSALLALWPSYLAFVLGFFTIVVAWAGHHLIVQQVRVPTWRFVYTNALFLLSITFLPFPTALVAEHLGHAGGTVAAAFYAGANLLTSLAFWVLHLAARDASPGAGSDFFEGLSRWQVGVFAVVGPVIVVLAFWSPLASLLAVALLWAWWAFPRAYR